MKYLQQLLLNQIFSLQNKRKPTHYTTTQQERQEYGCLGGSEPPGRRQLDLVSDKTTTKRPTFAQIQDYVIKVALTYSEFTQNEKYALETM